MKLQSNIIRNPEWCRIYVQNIGWQVFLCVGSVLLCWLSRWLVGNKMAAAIPNITLLSDRDQRDKYKPYLCFSSLAGDFPRVFFMSHWLELGCMLWQWLLVAVLLPASLALPPVQSTVSMWPTKASFWLEDRYVFQSSSSLAGPEVAQQTDRQVSWWEPPPWWHCGAPGSLTPGCFLHQGIIFASYLKPLLFLFLALFVIVI